MGVSQYGDVSFKLAGKDWTVRVGTREFKALEDRFKVAGIARCVNVGLESMTNKIGLGQIGLSKAHPTLTEDEVADLYDCIPVAGETKLEAAIIDAIKAYAPRLFESAKKSRLDLIAFCRSHQGEGDEEVLALFEEQERKAATPNAPAAPAATP